MHKADKCFIYTLSCPKTGMVRYIGKTRCLATRLAGHISERNTKHTRKSNWVRSVIESGDKPKIDALDEVLESEWQFWEQYWIQLFRGWGFDLVNGDNGGLGRTRVDAQLAKRIGNKLLGTTNKALQKQIHAYDANGMYLMSFVSVNEAAKNVSGSHANICRATKLETMAYGFRWSYEKASSITIRSRKKKSPESIEKTRQAHIGKTVSEETKFKQRIARLGKSPANKGKRFINGKYVSQPSES